MKYLYLISSYKMPNAHEFVTGFGLDVNSFKIEKWILIKVHAEHKMVELFNEYAYPILLTFYNKHYKKGDAIFLGELLRASLKRVRVIYSESDRPYKCIILSVKVGRVIKNTDGSAEVTVKLEGFSKRIGREEAINVNKTGRWL
jgi:hypothetical protein